MTVPTINAALTARSDGWREGVEAAAKVAENERWGERHIAASEVDGNTGPAHYNQACDDIATAIRNLTPPESTP